MRCERFVGSLAALLLGVLATSVSADFSRKPDKIRGVNFGGWLMLEYFITPDLFDKAGVQLSTRDEYTLHQALGGRAGEYLNNHYNTFFTEADFIKASQIGINVVRIPVGYWAILDNSAPFVKGSLDYLDKAFTWAERNNLWVLVDLHGAPGSQNPWDHSGRANYYQWHKDSRNVDATVSAIDKLSARYAGKVNLWGIGVLNEPFEIPSNILLDFYSRAYGAVRKYTSSAWVLFHDSFGYDGMAVKIANWSKSSGAYLTMVDTHRYTCFGGIQDPAKAISVAKDVYSADVAWLAPQTPIVVGEFSLAMTDFNSPYVGNHKLFDDNSYKTYWSTQLDAYNKGSGYMFWNFKLADSVTQRIPEWSLLESQRRGWIPANLGSDGPTPPPTPAPTPSPTGAPTPSTCSAVRQNVDFAGKDIAEVYAPQYTACCSECQKKANCGAWTWTNYNGGRCWLKEAGADAVAKPSNGAVSGTLIPVSSQCSGPKYDTDFYGNDVANVVAKDFSMCCAACQKQEGCGSWTWSSWEGGKCWLKTAAAANSPSVSKGAVSGVLSSTPTCSAPKFDTDFYGNDIGNVSAADFTSCCSACRNLAGCGAYTWSNWEGGKCWLKKPAAASNGGSFSQGAISGVLQ